jgi:hypothetical protein
MSWSSMRVEGWAERTYEISYLTARGTVRAFWTGGYLKIAGRQHKGRDAQMPVLARERTAAAMLDRAGSCLPKLQQDVLRRVQGSASA